MDVPDIPATTTYTYDIYDNMRSLTDPEGTVTSYNYDEFDRVEDEMLDDGLSPYYTISYEYVGGTGGGCGSCGGGGATDNVTYLAYILG